MDLHVIKRDGTREPFSKKKLELAIYKAIVDSAAPSELSEGYDANKIASKAATYVEDTLKQPMMDYQHEELTTEDVMRVSEATLMRMKYFDAARALILYRDHNKPDIFRIRTTFKPNEYPELYKYVEAIRHSYWLHTEFNYTSDMQDINVNMTNAEKTAAIRSMLAISQIEVDVKTFWGKIGDVLPKPEIQAVGATFAECHVAGTEILTPQGWLDFRAVTLDTDVVQYDKYTGQMTVTKPSNVVNEPYKGEVYRLENRVTSAVLTPNHRMIFTHKKSGEVVEKHIKDIQSFHSEMMLPVTGKLVGVDSSLSTIDRIRIAIQSDGSTRYWRNKEGTRISRGLAQGYQTYEISFNKERKKARFRQLLDDSGLPYREFTVSREGYVKYELDMPLDYDLKTFDWVDLSDKSSSWCNEFIEELAEWDGYRLDGKGNAKNCLIKYSTTNKQCADVVQAVGVCAGYKCHINTYSDTRKDTYSDAYTVSFTKTNLNSSMTLKPTVEQYDGSIHCVTVPTGVIVTRYNDRVLISGNSEVRHADAYANLLEILGLNEEFTQLKNVPAIDQRIQYLRSALVKPTSNEDYFYNVILFSMLIENVSLFSQFYILMSFNKHKGYLKGISNAISGTSKEELIHAQFGFDVVNIIKKENPSWWTEETKAKILDMVETAYAAELKILDWIFEEGDFDYLTKAECAAFLEYRIHDSLKNVGINYQVSPELALTDIKSKFEWFNVEMTSTSLNDGFNKRFTNYTKRETAITKEDLF